MATQPERIATLEEKVRGVETHRGISFSLFSLTVTGAVLWLGFLTVMLIGIGQRVSRIEGKLGNPLEATIKGLQSPDPVALSANLDLLSAQIAASNANHAAPKKENLAKLATTLKTVAGGHPNLPGTWRAVATLASYSTVQAPNSPRPDCDITQTPHLIEESEIPEFAGKFGSPSLGYVFRNCTLHLNHLPPGELTKFLGHIGNATKDTQYTAGDFAAIIDCDILLTDSGIAPSGILRFAAIKCRFEYRIDQVPNDAAQQLLLASLPTDSPGQFLIQLKS